MPRATKQTVVQTDCADRIEYCKHEMQINELTQARDRFNFHAESWRGIALELYGFIVTELDNNPEQLSSYLTSASLKAFLQDRLDEVTKIARQQIDPHPEDM